MTLEETEEFNEAYLQAWANADAEEVVSFHADDCVFFNDDNWDGLRGSKALFAYLEDLFARLPAMTCEADKVWVIDGGFCARSFSNLEGGFRLRSIDLHLLEGGRLVHSETYSLLPPGLAG